MSYTIRPPRLTGNDRQQLEQLKAFTFQLIDQIEYIVNDLSKRIDKINNTESEGK